jgi:3-oxoacyl-[acyl-carrier protein] reductase
MNILVTGGASGLGEAIVREFAGTPGNKVFFTYFGSEAAAKNLEKELIHTKSIHCDFTNNESIASLLMQIELFDLDVLVNNAIPGMVKKHFHKIDPEEFTGSFSRNVLPVIRITQKAILEFRKKKYGKIITVLSAAGISKPPVGWSEYVAAKAYIEALSRSWATENISFGITANCISPSFMATKLTGDTDERVVEEMIKNHPLKKLLTTEEVAQAIAGLSAASPHINGINLVMNAGTDLK